MRRLAMAIAMIGVATSWAQTSGLTLSELLFQPRTGEAEYVELYNAAADTLQLADYCIVRWLGDSLNRRYPLPSRPMPPQSYVALTRDRESIAGSYRVLCDSCIVECSLPPYPNAGGSVVLAWAEGEVVERLDYNPSMHSDLLRHQAGVSLERRSFHRPCNDPSNWYSAASTAGYGTPGYANSQSDERLVEAAQFVPSADIVSPDGDDYQDVWEVEYALARGDLAARAEVYDRSGRQVQRLLNGDLLGISGTIRWDGLDANGTRPPRGQYLVQILIYDAHGTQQRLRFPVAVLYP